MISFILGKAQAFRCELIIPNFNFTPNHPTLPVFAKTLLSEHKMWNNPQAERDFVYNMWRFEVRGSEAKDRANSQTRNTK